MASAAGSAHTMARFFMTNHANRRYKKGSYASPTLIFLICTDFRVMHIKVPE